MHQELSARGISQRFLERGAEVVICGREAPAQLPSHAGHEAWFVPCDVRDFAQLEALLAAIDERYGRLDVLINNAGGAPYADAADASPRFSEAIVRLNLLAPLNLCQLANQRMQKQANGGSIINICSVSATRPSPGTAAYGAAKAGLLALGRSLAVEWATRGVRVNAVAPTYIETPLLAKLEETPELIARCIDLTPMKRMGKPHEVASVVLFLASDASSLMTGSIVSADAGYTSF